MASRKDAFYGWSIKDIARICRVDPSTARKWKRGARVPPISAVLLIQADLGMFDKAWSGWTVRERFLISPEGWHISVNDVLAVPLMQLQIASYQRDLRAAREEILREEQPSPAEWPEWIEKFA